MRKDETHHVTTICGRVVATDDVVLTQCGRTGANPARAKRPSVRVGVLCVHIVHRRTPEIQYIGLGAFVRPHDFRTSKPSAQQSKSFASPPNKSGVAIEQIGDHTRWEPT